MAWSALHGWYDLGPPIQRTVISYKAKTLTSVKGKSKSGGHVEMNHELDLYPIFVRTILLLDATSGGRSRPFHQYYPISRHHSLKVVLDEFCQSLDVDPQRGRLWLLRDRLGNPNKSSNCLLDLEDNFVDQLVKKGTVGDTADLSDNEIVIQLEVMGGDGLWPSSPRRENSQGQGTKHVVNNIPGAGDGIVGLYNMGNTCYLNASVQCLSHTPLLKDYFTSKAYLNDINKTNPLGYKGQLAQVSAMLIHNLWKPFKRNQQKISKNERRSVVSPKQYIPIDAPSVTPKTFKETLGHLNDIFAGNDQHDAHELLAFLLSGLSEDLNRIVDKPYTEAPDSDGRPDKDLADIWWQNHLKRETSIIVALFTGQYKSLLTCRTCGYESARFEPFCFLQVPLPEDDQIVIQFILFPLGDKSNPTKYSIRSRSDGTLFDALVNLAHVLYSDGVLIPEDEVGSSNVPKKNESTSSKQTVDKNAGEEKREDVFARIAQNLAVVKMDESYIYNIVPVSFKERHNAPHFLSKIILILTRHIQCLGSLVVGKIDQYREWRSSLTLRLRIRAKTK